MPATKRFTNLDFHKLNHGWNAAPNDPAPIVEVIDSLVRLSFELNRFQFDADRDERAQLGFSDCSAWRLGETNDHGWYLGQCRYSSMAPAWGEFYELIGEDTVRDQPDDWQRLAVPRRSDRHFLFYLRDETFECLASGWSFTRGRTRT